MTINLYDQVSLKRMTVPDIPGHRDLLINEKSLFVNVNITKKTRIDVYDTMP